jgi:hypothetical protein
MTAFSEPWPHCLVYVLRRALIQPQRRDSFHIQLCIMTRNHSNTAWSGVGAQNRTLTMCLLVAVFTRVNSSSLRLGC